MGRLLFRLPSPCLLLTLLPLVQSCWLDYSFYASFSRGATANRQELWGEGKDPLLLAILLPTARENSFAASAALLIRLELERNKERMEENERITNIEGMEGKMLPLF
jgi:hypothetical protein